MSSPPPDGATVMYVIAWGRSGSTVLGDVLNAVPGTFHAGELRHFWARYGSESFACGCGETLAECSFWGAIGAKVLRAPDDQKRMLAIQRRVSRTRRISHLLSARDERDLDEDERLFVGGLRTLYRAIADETGASLVVDTSKKVAFGALARFAIPGGFQFVHLVRDPRASAYSWSKVRASDPSGQRHMPRHGAVSSSLNWIICNAGAERVRSRVDRSMPRIRYEDFAESPQGVISSLLQRVGKDMPADLFDERNSVRLSAGHAFAGNPSRFQQGPVSITPDQGWRAAQLARDRLVCEALTAPFVMRYGYALHVSKK